MSDLKTVKFTAELYESALAARAELLKLGYDSLPADWLDPQKCFLCDAKLDEGGRCRTCKMTYFKRGGSTSDGTLATMAVFLLIGVNALLSRLSTMVGICGVVDPSQQSSVRRACGGRIVRRVVKTPFPPPHDRAHSLEMSCERCGTRYEVGEHHELRVVPQPGVYSVVLTAATDAGLGAKQAAKIAKQVEVALAQSAGRQG